MIGTTRVSKRGAIHGPRLVVIDAEHDRWAVERDGRVIYAGTRAHCDRWMDALGGVSSRAAQDHAIGRLG